jgi:hypothetical protein
MPNLVTVTLTERKQTCTDTYLFEFIDSAKNYYYCIANDLSLNDRYNKFIINSVTASADNTNAEIDFNLNTQYTYNIYENPSSSLSPVGLWNCETGIAKVLNAPTGSVYFTGSTVLPIYQVYAS